LFTDCNATRHDATVSQHPDVVRFDVVKEASCFAVPELLRRFYQAEVLIPSPLPPLDHVPELQAQTLVLLLHFPSSSSLFFSFSLATSK